MQDLAKIFSTNDAKYNFILGCARIAGADGNICDEEVDYLTAVAHQMGMGLDKISDVLMSVKRRDGRVKFKTKFQGLFLIKELLQICYVDGSYTTQERAELYVLAEELGIPRNEVEKLEEWVSDGIEWRNRGEKLLEELAE